MKKRITAITIMICIMAVLIPTVSRAAVEPYFMAINDTVLEFSDDTMPYLSGSEIFIPVRIFKVEGLGILAIDSDQEERVLLFKGRGKYLDFSTMPGSVETRNQDGNILYWPSARRVGKTFYVPLRQVCDYFDLTYVVLSVPHDIIPSEQMQMIRIISNAKINGSTFLSLNKNKLREAYNKYYAPPDPPPLPTGPSVPRPSTEPPANYSDVTIHLSFYNISEDTAEGILDLLVIQAASGYRSCFFVSAEDIVENPDLIRRIAGSGHSIGINLIEGTYNEYLETSALLFEAAKIKTLLACAEITDQINTAQLCASGLILWEKTADPKYDDISSAENITASITKERGARQSLILSCSEEAALILPGIISFLWVNEYTIERITETVEPIGRIES